MALKSTRTPGSRRPRERSKHGVGVERTIDIDEFVKREHIHPRCLIRSYDLRPRRQGRP